VEAVQYQKDQGLEDGFAVYETEYPEEGHTFELNEDVDTTRVTIIQAAVQTPAWQVVSEGDWIVTFPNGQKEIWSDTSFKEMFQPSLEEEMLLEYSRQSEFRGYTPEEIYQLGMLKAMEIAGIAIPGILHPNSTGSTASDHECPKCGSDLDYWGGTASCPNDDCDFERPMTPEELED
jgi:hypothetical protein